MFFDGKGSLRAAMATRWQQWVWAGLAAGAVWAAGAPAVPVEPPAPPREFRAAWIATVRNLHWPSRPGLSSAQQQQELLQLLDAAARLGLNAVILQVRPAGDAFYASDKEPWSYYLTGEMGRPPEPYYDPLAFAIREAHARGLELHAWFNPFRVLIRAPTNPTVSSRHISRVRPEWVRSYGPYLWLDPGEPGVTDYVIETVLDVVRRYDVDGVHFDDYFYPYPEKDSAGRPLPFPDERSWAQRDAADGPDRDTWRRQNVDRFVERLYRAVKEARPTVKVGISPFGIWRPDHPRGVRGLDAYAVLYADARKWLQEGWLDYCAPQLYWPTTAREQPFVPLLEWWEGQNTRHRHLWPGLNTARGSDWGAEEILKQIQSVRRTTGHAAGHIHWHLPGLLRQTNLVQALLRGPYARAALVPEASWLPGRPPDKPRLEVGTESGSRRVHLHWNAGTNATVRFWYLQVLQANGWTSRRLDGNTRSAVWDDARAVALVAVGPDGRTSPAAVWRRPADRSRSPSAGSAGRKEAGR
jgi:uncharacterized lipoprotein YddW (UPF0748 family)